jgi:NAD(P)-dependent dehydrogenase (short-subunit alcohol dehydrogenase family)
MRNKKVLITGGTGGLGRAVTRKALEAEARVTVSYRSENEISLMSSFFAPQEIENITFIRANLMQEDEVRHLVSQIPGLEVLIHLVGGFDMGPTKDFPLEKWNHQINLNLTSAFLISKACLEQMYKNNYGRIVTVGSRAAVEPGAQVAAYAAAKAGLVAFTRSIAAETIGTRITANCILPSVIDTPDNRRSMGDKHADKWVKPESVAGLICYLASEAAQDIRGAVIPVYGSL